MIRTILAASAFSMLLTACGTYQQVAEIDASTGLLPTEVQATTVNSKTFDMDSRKDLLVFVGDNDFVINQVSELDYFEEVLSGEALEAAIVRADLTDKVPTVDGLIGLNNAAKHYKPFVYLDFDSRQEGANGYLQLVLTDAQSMDELFRAERYLDTIWEGVNDRNTFYPLFNALISYISDNSETYGVQAAAAADETAEPAD